MQFLPHAPGPFLHRPNGFTYRFRMRVFSANDEFPVDIYNHRGNMKCKARQELCRTDGLPDRDALTSALATPLECAHTKNASANPLQRASMRHAPVSITSSTRALLYFFSFCEHYICGSTRSS